MTTSRARRAHPVPDIYTPSAGYVIIGHHQGSEMEVIGNFASELDAREWADTHDMYTPYTIAWMNDPNDEIYK